MDESWTYIYTVFVLIFLCFNIPFIHSAAPVFSYLEVPLLVREDTTSETFLGAFNVTDPDGSPVTSCSHTGDAGEFDIRQNVSDNSLFELYVLSGASIEYENTSQFILEITCTDGQSESSAQNITVDVIPNQPPVIIAPASPLSISENIVTQTLLHVLTVNDVENDTIFCNVQNTSPDSSDFGILWDSVNLVYNLYVMSDPSLNYSAVPMYTVSVECWDYFGTSGSSVVVFVLPNTAPTFNNLPGFTMAPTVTTNKAAFTARISGHENHGIQTSATFIFDTVLTNVGGHYSGTTGQFTAPVDGTYFFMATMMTCVNGYIEANIVKNGGFMVPIHAADTEQHEMATAGSTMVLNRGDIVEVKHNGHEGECVLVDQSVDASSTSMGTTVFTVSAHDNDSSTMTYSMTSFPVTPDLFAIDTVSGEVKTTKDLIYAVDGSYLLTVTVSDGVSTTTEHLRFFLSNVNTAPTISNLPAEVYKDEDINWNSVIYTIDRNDPDNGDSVTATITVWPAAYASKFNIYQDKHLRAQGGESLNYEDQHYFVIQFTVSDGKAETGPYNLTVFINDVFEACTFNAPTYYVTMYEGNAGVVSADPGLTVTDEDIGDIYTLSIDYTASTDSGYFSINDTSGVITFATDYDVDITHPADVQLTVVCTDLDGKTGTSTVSVTVLDVNDNTPKFDKAGYIFYIDQFDGPTTAFKQMDNFCSDADSGINADIEYNWTELTAGSSTYFHMNTNGKVILLTYPAVSMNYGDIHSFLVTAVDQGTPPLSDSTRLDIVYMETNISANLSVLTTLAPASNSTSTESADSFWDEPVNIIIVVLVVLVGALLVGFVLYFCMKWCRKPVNDSLSRTHRKFPSGRVQSKIEPKPITTKEPFSFWGKDMEIGGVTYMHNAVPKPSV